MLRVKKLSNEAKLPTKGSVQSAGYDLYTTDTVTIQPHETKSLHTGLSLVPPAGYFCAIFARSGLATKHGLRPANCVGVCDEDYRGEYMVALYNDSDTPYCVKSGDRVAQMVLLPYLDEEIVEVEELEGTARGIGGFGSTGT